MNFDVCTALTASEKNKFAQKSKAEYILFCGNNALDENAISALEIAIKGAPANTAIFELRQFPFEHPKFYNPETCEAIWACGDASLVRRSAWKAVGGYDESVFQDIVDVDFSFRLQVAMWRLQYVPTAIINTPPKKPPTPEQEQIALAKKVTASLMMVNRFGNDEDKSNWKKRFWEMIGNVSTTQEMEHRFMKRMHELKHKEIANRFYYEKNVKNSHFEPKFVGFDFAFLRTGEFYKNEIPTIDPEITIVIRTFKRPNHLERTLHSLKWQTYKNFKVVVVEDGENPVCAPVCKRGADYLNIEYIAANKNVGRCNSGNMGVNAAQTDYVCFLDDDDFLFAEHLEVMVSALQKNQDCKLFFASSVEAACKAGDKIEITQYWNNRKIGLTLEQMLDENPVSIQSVLFAKDLFTQVGGLNPELDALEDWDLWIRCAIKERFVCIDKATSLYRVPCKTQDYAARAANFAKYREIMQQKIAEYCQENEIELISDETAETLQENANLEELRKTALAVSKAKGYVLAAPLRCFFKNKKAEQFGVVMPNWETADRETCNRFVFLARTSVFWQICSKGKK